MERMIRPKAVVLPGSAQVPDRNLVVPPPNQFTHALAVRQSYYYTGVRRGAAPDGEFPAGTKLVLLRYEGGSRCRVVDGRGLYVETEYAGLKKLS